MAIPNPVHRRHGRGPRHRIRDPKALAALVKDLIAAPFADFGTVDIAARKTKINRSTWYRLLSGTHPGLSQDLAHHLETLIKSYLGKAGRKRFLAAMTVPGANRVIEAYYSWGRERNRRHWRAAGALWERADGGLRRVVGRDKRSSARDGLARGLELAIRAEVPEYLGFEQWVQERFIDRSRVLVAKMRILEPFLDAADSAFVEMSWHELPEDGRRERVKSSIKWERWLLEQRGPHQGRAEQVAAGKEDRNARPGPPR